MARAALALVPVAIALLAIHAAAQPPAPNRPFDAAPDDPGASWTLEYSAPTGCPDERELRSIVAASMGHDPFANGAEPRAHTLRLRIIARPGGFAGTVERRDPAGRLTWERPALTDADCGRLVSILGSVSIRAAVQTAPPTQAPLPVPPSHAPPPPLSPPLAPAAELPAFRLGARGSLAIGLLPLATAAFSADIGAAWRHVSVNLEGLATLPAERDLDHGVRLRSSLLAGSLAPCGHYGWFTGCGLVTVGALRSEGTNSTIPASSTGIYVGAGLRAALDVPLHPAFALRASADALVNLHPLAAQILTGTTQAKATPVEVWRTDPFAGVLGAGVVLRFGGASAGAAGK